MATATTTNPDLLDPSMVKLIDELHDDPCWHNYRAVKGYSCLFMPGAPEEVAADIALRSFLEWIKRLTIEEQAKLLRSKPSYD